jgi:hypothetical protein
MNDSFHATFKLITGEEVLAEVMPATEHGMQFFVLYNPITIHETTTIDHQRGIIASGLSPRKWLMYSNDDTTIVNKSHVVGMTELDKFGIDFYQKAVLAAKVASPIRRKISSDENIGYVGKVEAARDLFEKLYEG